MNDQNGEKSDDVVNMVQVLEDEELLQEDAKAVLGDSDAVQCTYSKGYIPRQALYACRTCRTRDKEMAGVCLACALECHEGHDLVELYTKRYFCCDCGNSQFVEGVTACKLFPEKSVNSDNRYNHNFSGLYCRCARPYPDPEDSVDDQMLQCTICEDWYHGRHLGREDEMPAQEEFEEVTCETCTDRCNFLRTYAHHCAGTTADRSVTDTSVVDVVLDVTTNTDNGELNASANAAASEAETDGSGTPDPVHCKLRELSREDADQPPSSATGAVFWCSGWRRRLCKCPECLAMYESHGVSFLTDENDTIAAYEERGKQMSTKSSYDKGLEALSSMNHVQQVELVHGFVELKTELKDYLKKFADNGKVVREEDITEFFQQLEAKKRSRTDGPHQYFCK